MHPVKSHIHSSPDGHRHPQNLHHWASLWMPHSPRQPCSQRQSDWDIPIPPWGLPGWSALRWRHPLFRKFFSGGSQLSNNCDYSSRPSPEGKVKEKLRWPALGEGASSWPHRRLAPFWKQRLSHCEIEALHHKGPWRNSGVTVVILTPWRGEKAQGLGEFTGIT